MEFNSLYDLELYLVKAYDRDWYKPFIDAITVHVDPIKYNNFIYLIVSGDETKQLGDWTITDKYAILYI